MATQAPRRRRLLEQPDQEAFLDQVSFSSMGKDMQTAKTALGNTPDVRESKIQDLKRRIDNGTYDVSVDDFAQKLLDSYSKTNI